MNAETERGGGYDQFAPLLITLGLCPLPIEPGTKRPALYTGTGYAPMLNWTTRPPITTPQPGAGIGVRLGNGLVAFDIDTDDVEIGCALINVVLPRPEMFTITKTGKRGQTLFFRPPSGQRMPSRRFKVKGVIVAELLSVGKQTVLPPTIHPDTDQPYTWGNGLTLFNTQIEDLPELPADVVEQIAAVLVPFGYEPEEEEGQPQRDSFDTPHGELNYLALRKLAAWVPDLPNIYSLRRLSGPTASYEGVALWRPSSTGRPTEVRKRNLKISGRKGIKDFGTDETFSPLDLVMRARSCTLSEAVAWLDERVRPNIGPKVDFDTLGKRAKAEQPQPEPPKLRFKLVAFGDMRPGPEQLYLVDELIPVAGLVDIWGKAKCFKSFWTLDLMFHVAMGWEYRDRSVQQGTVVYCAFEGAHGYKKRIEAIRRHYEIAEETTVPLYIMPGQANLISEHKLLIRDIQSQLGETKLVAVVLDTLNKSLIGSESKDTDMSAYVRAAEAIRDAFHCVVIIVHHCGLDDTRPRGHTSLPGAVDAQLAVTREADAIRVEVEMMRDGPEETVVNSAVERIEVGEDSAGKTLTSLVVVPSEEPILGQHAGPKWTNMLRLFRRALCNALNDADDTKSVHGILTHVADLEHVRNEFYAFCVVEGETTEVKRKTREKRFLRCVRTAQELNLIGVLNEPSGRTLVWLAHAETPQL